MMNKKEIIIGLAAALFLAILVSPFASSWPDGLEKVAEDKGFLEKAGTGLALTSPILDYAWPGVGNEKLATSFAGAAGTLFIFGVGYAVALMLKRRKV